MIHEYPFTNFNEYNLDWLVQRVRDLTEEWKATHDEWENVEAEWESYKDWFSNLDVQDEIDHKINQMVLDGSFQLIVRPFFDEAISDIPSVVTDWLDANVDPATGYVIDDSLTIGGAAADAKVTGDAVSDLKNAVRSTTGREILPVTAYDSYVATNGATADITTISPSTSGNKCIIVPCSAGDQFTVNALGQSSARAWAFLGAIVSGNDRTVLSKSGVDANVSNLQLTAPENATYLVINDKDGRTSFKWVPVLAEMAFLKTGIHILGTSAQHKDLNDYKTAGSYYCESGTEAGYIDNKPVNLSFRMFVVNCGPQSYTRIKQIIIPNIASGNIYYRYFNGTTWSEWDRISGNKQLPWQSIEFWGAAADGATDCTAAINAALSACPAVYIPRGEYLISETIVIPFGRKLYGAGRSSQIKLMPTFNLTPYAWRPNRPRYPIFVVQNNCVLEDFLLEGDDTTPFDGGMVGFYINGDHVALKNVSTQDINYFPDDWIGGTSGYGTENAPGWGVGILHCTDVSITGGSFDGNGYEGIGTEDCDDVRITNVFVGNGNRTGIQLHRGSNKVTISNSVIDNTCVNANAQLTIHPEQNASEYITNISISNCQFGITDPREECIMFPQAYVDNLMVCNCILKATQNVSYMEGREVSTNGRFIFNNNIALCDTNGFRLLGGQNVFVGNYIDTLYKAISTGSTIQEASGNLFIRANVVS